MEGPKPSGPYPEPPPPYSQEAQPGYPSSAQPGYPSTQPGYPSSAQPGYPSSGQPAYAGAAPGYPGKGVPPNMAGPQTVVMGPPQPGQVSSVTVVSVAQWGPYSMQISCPHCRAQVMTETSASPGLLTWLLAGALIFFGCWIGCCLIPCCIPECQDIEHRCPNCKQHLGTYRRL